MCLKSNFLLPHVDILREPQENNYYLSNIETGGNVIIQLIKENIFTSSQNTKQTLMF